MRVTFLLPMRPVEPIGGFRVVYQYANGLARLGHDVQVVHPARLRQHPPVLPRRPRALVGHLRARARSAAARVRRTDRRLTWQDMDPRVELAFVSTLHARHIRTGEVVFATSWETAEYVGELPPDRGRPFYLIQHHETWSGSEARVDATWRLPLHKVFVAQWLFDKAQAMGLRDTTLISTAIDTELFRVVAPLTERKPRVAMMYSPHAWKGTDVGLAALELAKQQAPGLEAVIFGVTPRPSQAPPWVVSHQRPTPEVLVREIYNASSIYLCPSFAEGWHLPPAEAMACGCALVSTDIQGVHGYAEHGRNAILCAPGDAQALADGLLTLLRDDARRRLMAAQAAQKMQSFSWDRSCAELDRLLRT